MEHYIAIDNVCAWPNLTLLPDGTLIATIFNQPCHGLWEGDVDCWASTDDGRFWAYQGTAAPHDAGTNRMNVAAGLARNGDLLVLSSGWTHRPRKGQGSRRHHPPAHTLLPWICRSADGGTTWTHTEMVTGDAIQAAWDAGMIPFGDLVQLQDGALGACIYGKGDGEELECRFYTSMDDGDSWSQRGMIQSANINETAPLVLPNGEVLACARTRDDQHLELFRSGDHGVTWSREGSVSQPLQHPAHLLLLTDGRVLMTYGDRREGHMGIGVRLSADAGKTWGDPYHLFALEDADLGYPSTVQLADGILVTAWYASTIPAHQRYHMGVARWTLDEFYA